jgi:hypothetical protein
MTWLTGLVICLCFAFAVPCPSAARDDAAIRRVQVEKLLHPAVKPATTIGDFDTPKDLLLRPAKERQMKLGTDRQGLADAIAGQPWRDFS